MNIKCLKTCYVATKNYKNILIQHLTFENVLLNYVIHYIHDVCKNIVTRTKIELEKCHKIQQKRK